MRPTDKKVEETINSLCDWTIKVCEQGGTSEQLAILPEVVEGIANLTQALR